jgi:hypothetical protein
MHAFLFFLSLGRLFDGGGREGWLAWMHVFFSREGFLMGGIDDF